MPYDKTEILNAINSATQICIAGKRDVRVIIEALIGEPLEEPIAVPPKTYRIGMKFNGPIGDYILAQTETSKVSMIDLRTGNRYRQQYAVDDVLRITPDEMRAICGPEGDFTEEIPF